MPPILFKDLVKSVLRKSVKWVAPVCLILPALVFVDGILDDLNVDLFESVGRMEVDFLSIILTVEARILVFVTALRYLEICKMKGLCCIYRHLAATFMICFSYLLNIYIMSVSPSNRTSYNEQVTMDRKNISHFLTSSCKALFYIVGSKLEYAISTQLVLATCFNFIIPKCKKGQNIQNINEDMLCIGLHRHSCFLAYMVFVSWCVFPSNLYFILPEKYIYSLVLLSYILFTTSGITSKLLIVQERVRIIYANIRLPLVSIALCVITVVKLMVVFLTDELDLTSHGVIFTILQLVYKNEITILAFSLLAVNAAKLFQTFFEAFAGYYNHFVILPLTVMDTFQVCCVFWLLRSDFLSPPSGSSFTHTDLLMTSEIAKLTGILVLFYICKAQGHIHGRLFENLRDFILEDNDRYFLVATLKHYFRCLFAIALIPIAALFIISHMHEYILVYGYWNVTFLAVYLYSQIVAAAFQSIFKYILLTVAFSEYRRDRAQFVDSMKNQIDFIGKLMECHILTSCWMDIIEECYRKASVGMSEEFIWQAVLFWVIYIISLLGPLIGFIWKKFKTRGVLKNIQGCPTVQIAEEEYCAICRERMTSGLQLRCAHVFHEECLKQCLEYNMLKCPLCQREMSSK